MSEQWRILAMSLGILVVAIGAATLTLMTRCVPRGLSARSGVKSRGSSLPYFVARDEISGEIISHETLVGHRAVVALLSPACVSCLRVVPWLAAVAEQFPDAAQIMIVAGAPVAARTMKLETETRLPVISDHYVHLIRRLGITEVPIVLVISPTGRIAEVLKPQTPGEIMRALATVDPSTGQSAGAAPDLGAPSGPSAAAIQRVETALSQDVQLVLSVLGPTPRSLSIGSGQQRVEALLSGNVADFLAGRLGIVVSLVCGRLELRGQAGAVASTLKALAHNSHASADGFAAQCRDHQGFNALCSGPGGGSRGSRLIVGSQSAQCRLAAEISRGLSDPQRSITIAEINRSYIDGAVTLGQMRLFLAALADLAAAFPTTLPREMEGIAWTT